MKYTNKYNLPSSFVDVVENLTYDITESDPKRIGITTLISNPRIRLLSIKHWNELEDDVSNHIWRITGSAYHYILAKTKQRQRLIEEKITQEIDGITLVSKPDIYDYETKSIEDYKVTSVWSFKFSDRVDWTNQLNSYAWILRKCGFSVENLLINGILRDWSKRKSRQEQDYPKIPFQQVKIKMWSTEEQEQFIKERVALYKEALNTSIDKLPICSPKERWETAEVFAIYKGKLKKAVKLCKTLEEAQNYIVKNNIPHLNIQKRPATDLKCTEYCSVNRVCGYWKEKYGDKKT